MKSRSVLDAYPLYPGASGTSLTVGTVSIAGVGSPPTVTISGTAPNQVINFTLPNPLSSNGFRRVTDTSGAVTVQDTDGIICIENGVPTNVYFTQKFGRSFIVKDGNGVDGAGAQITLVPATGLIDGQATYPLNKSVLNSPPYESIAVFCKDDGNAILL